MWTIGQVARVAGVGVETVRFYEREGLIEQPPRPMRGVRRYTAAAIAHIRFIKRAQQLGFSLREAAALIRLRADESADCAAARHKAQMKLDQVKRQIENLAEIRSTLEEMIARCPGKGDLTKCAVMDGLSAPPYDMNDDRGGMLLLIDGMRCPECASVVEAVAAGEPGVESARVSFLERTLRVVPCPDGGADAERIAKAVRRIGYGAVVLP